MDVSVIIVNYNTLQMTQECIDSVFNKTKDVEYEVILVDNASTDGSKEHFEKDDRIRYIYSNENLGFGRANNLGYNYAKGNFLFFLNSDTILLNNAVKDFLLNMSMIEEKIAVMGCILTDREGKVTHSYGKFPNLKFIFFRSLPAFIKKVFVNFLGFDYAPQFVISNNCFEVDYVTGADIFMRRSVADKLGLFDPDFFMYYEEVEMQYRYKTQGYKNCIINSPQIQHLEGGSNKKNGRWNRCNFISLIICVRKMYGDFMANIVKILVLFENIPVAFLDWRFSLRDRLMFLYRILAS